MVDNISKQPLDFEIIVCLVDKPKPVRYTLSGNYNRQMLIEKLGLDKPNIKSYEIYVRFVVKCVHCGVLTMFNLKLSGLEKWLNERKLIQNCFPDVPREKRELLISGVCPTCFDKILSPEEDENE